MANAKRVYAGGGEGRCAVHRGSPQEKWRRTRDATEDIAGNLKEAIKVLQDENSASILTSGPPSLQATEAKRKVAVKKALNKLGRALNQVSTVVLYTADLSEEMLHLQEKLESSEKSQLEVSEQMATSTSEMQEQLKFLKAKLQETLDRLHDEEGRMASMIKEVEATKLSADRARLEKMTVQEQLRLQEAKQGYAKLAASEENLRVENEKLRQLYMSALKEKDSVDLSNEVALKNATANVERYKEVVAKVTADNMVFLMKLKHSESALTFAQRRLGELQKEIDTGRAQWLDEASSEIREVIRSSLSKAETCESKLQVMERRLGKLDAEWEEKLQAASEKLAQVTSSRDWLQRNLVEASEKYRALEDEKLKLVHEFEGECQDRQTAEAESRALICTLRKTNEELADVNVHLGAAIKEIEAQKACVHEKEKEIRALLADLDRSSSQLETQQSVNAALMKRKEEIEWELMAVEAQRAKLQQSFHEKLDRTQGRNSPLANFL